MLRPAAWPLRSHKGQGTVRRHSAGTNTVVEHRSRDAWSVERRVQRMKQDPDRCCVRRLGLCDPTRGRALSEDIPPERPPWTNTEAGTRGVVEKGETERRAVEGASMTTGSGGELPHRFDRCPETLGQGRAAHSTKGGREWARGAKGGQPEKASGCEGGGAFDGAGSAPAAGAEGGGALMVVGPEPAIGESVRWGGAGAGAEGPAVGVAAVSVVEAPVLGGGASGG